MKMNKIKEIIEKRKEKAQIEKEAVLKSDFRVVERGGALWLTHCGVAFMKVPAATKSEDVAKMLNDARSNAIEFVKL